MCARGASAGLDEVDVSLDGLDGVVEVAVERLLGEAQREPLGLAKRNVRWEAQRAWFKVGASRAGCDTGLADSAPSPLSEPRHVRMAMAPLISHDAPLDECARRARWAFDGLLFGVGDERFVGRDRVTSGTERVAGAADCGVATLLFFPRGDLASTWSASSGGVASRGSRAASVKHPGQRKCG